MSPVIGEMYPLDLFMIAFYFSLVAIIAWVAYKQQGSSSSDYFLAGRNLEWIAVAASLFMSNIGSEHLVGLAGTGAASGLAVGHFEWLACFILLLLGWLFVPFYLRSGVVTMPEFLERRYSSACRWYFTLISVVGYVLTKISVALYAGGIILGEALGLNFWVSATLIVVVTGLYTMIGGLRAVVYVDIMQAIVLIVGSGLLLYLGLVEVGGWQAMIDKAPPDFFNMWKPITHADFPWTGIIFGAPILGIWYWCTDQYIVQKVLCAKSEEAAQSGTVFGAYLKILPLFLFVLPGVLAIILVPELTRESSDRALPALVSHLMGPGLRGIFFAGLLAALMSSLSSIFNSCSTLITWDIYKKLRPQASERTLVLVGRSLTGVLIVLGLAWIPFMKYISSQVYIYLQSVQGYIAPPIAACFLLGLFMPRLNASGAIASLAVGFVLGFSRLILELVNGVARDVLPAGTWLEWITELNFLHFAILLFVVCVGVLVLVSQMTPPPSEEKLRGLTWRYRLSPQAGGPVSAQPGQAVAGGPAYSYRTKVNIFFSVLLSLIIFILWSYFS